MRRLVFLAPFLLGCPLALADFAVEDASVDALDPPDVGGDGDAAFDANDVSVVSRWSPIAPSPLGGREKASSCTFSDGRLLVWGGDDGSKALATGALYDATNDSWTAIATANAPSARVLATAVCVGTKAVVWGGGDLASTIDYKDGAIYDATADAWSVIPNPPGALPPARASFGERVGAVAVYWGGVFKNGAPANGAGAAFDPSGNTWTGFGGGGPPALIDPAIAATSAQYVVFGGQAGPADQNDLFIQQGTGWAKSTSTTTPRHGAFASFDGSVFVAWGGAPGLQSGATFTFPSGPWKATTTQGAPTARAAVNARTGWAFAIAQGKSALLSGVLATAAIAHDGAIYDSSADAWTAIPAWESSEDHEWGVAAWTGSALVAWGGRTGSQVVATGERFAP